MLTPKVGDRIAFELAQPGPQAGTTAVMNGTGFVMAAGGPGAEVLVVAVLGYAGVLTLPAAACRVLETGALLRRVVTE